MGFSSDRSSTMNSVPSAMRSETIRRNASFATFLFTFTEKSRGLGPKATPPPRQTGDCLRPARARPVPFCFQGLRLEPFTSPLLRVEAVPAR